jgi:Tfp pilus assembly protein PilF
LLVIPALRSADIAGDWRDDVSLYGADVARNPNDGRALYHYGYAIYRRGGCPQALPWFGRAARYAPGYPRTWHNLAGCLLNVGRPAEALGPARRAVALDPDNPDNHFNLGLALASTGHPNEAIASLRRALALAPGHAPARRLLGSLTTPRP